MTTLGTGILTQQALPPTGTPARKDDFVPVVLGPNRRPPLNGKNPFDREKMGEAAATDEEEVYFDGNVLNITLPVREEEIEQYDGEEDLEAEVGETVRNVLVTAFGETDEAGENVSGPAVQVMVSESQNRRTLIINAQPANEEGESGRGQTTTVSRFVPTSEAAGTPLGSPTSRRPIGTAATTPTPGNSPEQTTYRADGPEVIKFGLKDAITPSSTARDRPSTDATNLDFDGNSIGTGDYDSEAAAPGTDGLPAPFDNRLQQNSILGGGSSADIVEATVVEDFDYARRVRDRNSRDGGGSGIGIATISSITVGIISILIFCLLIFLAVGRRRRRQSEDFVSGTTPSQSRTTITGTPVPTSKGGGTTVPTATSAGGGGDTPSMTTTYLDDVLSGPPSSSIQSPPTHSEPVLPIDGHQTIVHSYGEFLASSSGGGGGGGGGGAAGAGGKGILATLPPPPLSSPGSVPGTRDLSDDNEYLFAPSTTTGTTPPL